MTVAAEDHEVDVLPPGDGDLAQDEQSVVDRLRIVVVACPGPSRAPSPAPAGCSGSGAARP